MGHSFFLLGLLAAGSAMAATHAATFAVGDCADEELLSLSQELAGSLKQRQWQGELLSNDTVRRRLDAEELSHPDELRLRLNGAQALFYNGALAKADEQLIALLQDVAKLPPGNDRLALFQEAHVLRAMTLRNQDKNPLADEELKAVLRTDPAFTLDADNYAPALRARLEKLRKELGPTGTLRVTSEPPGANVYVDGKALGTTPLQRELPAGNYGIDLVADNRNSFPHPVRIEKGGSASVRVDIGFETAIDTHGFPCLRETNPREPRMGNAIKLATLLEVDELVLVRVEKPASGMRWLNASLVNVQSAQRVREGGIQIKRDDTQRAAAMSELAHFALTGAPSPRVTPVPVSAFSATGNEALRPRTAGPEKTWKTPVGITAAVIAGGATAAGIVLAVRSAGHWKEFDAYYEPSGTAPTPSELPAVATLKRQAETERTWAIVSFTGAAAFAAGSVVLLVLESRGEIRPSQSVTLKPVLSPWSAGLAGTF